MEVYVKTQMSKSDQTATECMFVCVGNNLVQLSSGCPMSSLLYALLHRQELVCITGKGGRIDLNIDTDTTDILVGWS